MNPIVERLSRLDRRVRALETAKVRRTTDVVYGTPGTFSVQPVGSPSRFVGPAGSFHANTSTALPSLVIDCPKRAALFVVNGRFTETFPSSTLAKWSLFLSIYPEGAPMGNYVFPQDTIFIPWETSADSFTSGLKTYTSSTQTLGASAAVFEASLPGDRCVVDVTFSPTDDDGETNITSLAVHYLSLSVTVL